MQNPELDRALEQIDIEQYLDNEGIDYRHSHGTRGLQLNLRECPACHNEGYKTYINAELGLGNCFHGSCGFKFNRFKLVRAVSGLSGKALDGHIFALAEQQGWMPKRERPQLIQAELQLPSKTDPLPNERGNLAYLERRGVDGELAAFFHLHHCRQGAWWSTTLSDGTKKWMPFERRVLIPVLDLDGRMVSFQGRDLTGEAEPKYQFPAGYAVAGSHLYNGNSFAEGEHTHAVVGEGAFDCIAIHKALQEDSSCASIIALATFGMHLSDGPGGQIEKFAQLHARGLKVITIMWDSEGKALREAVKAGLKLRELGFVVRIAQLPAGCDPAQDADGHLVPGAVVRKAIFEAMVLNRMNAVRLMGAAARM